MWTQWRERAGLTQKRLADAIGVTPSFISAFESSKTRGCRVDTLEKWTVALNLNESEVVKARDDVRAREQRSRAARKPRGKNRATAAL